MGCISSILSPPAPQPSHPVMLLTFLVEALGTGWPAKATGQRSRQGEGFRIPLSFQHVFALSYVTWCLSVQVEVNLSGCPGAAEAVSPPHPHPAQTGSPSLGSS